jgi:hypothetical protein
MGMLAADSPLLRNRAHKAETKEEIEALLKQSGSQPGRLQYFFRGLPAVDQGERFLLRRVQREKGFAGWCIRREAEHLILRLEDLPEGFSRSRAPDRIQQKRETFQGDEVQRKNAQLGLVENGVWVFHVKGGAQDSLHFQEKESPPHRFRNDLLIKESFAEAVRILLFQDPQFIQLSQVYFPFGHQLNQKRAFFVNSLRIDETAFLEKELKLFFSFMEGENSR